MTKKIREREGERELKLRHRTRKEKERGKEAERGRKGRRDGSEGGGGEGFAAGAGGGVLDGDDAGGLHLEEADVKANGSGHEKVVVLADDGAVRAIGALFIDEEFIETAGVALDVKAFADDLDEG